MNETIIREHQSLGDWEFSHTEYQYPEGFSGSATKIEYATEYAYWINKKTLEVKKVEVKN